MNQAERQQWQLKLVNNLNNKTMKITISYLDGSNEVIEAEYSKHDLVNRTLEVKDKSGAVRMFDYDRITNIDSDELIKTLSITK